MIDTNASRPRAAHGAEIEFRELTDRPVWFASLPVWAGDGPTVVRVRIDEAEVVAARHHGTDTLLAVAARRLGDRLRQMQRAFDRDVALTMANGC